VKVIGMALNSPFDPLSKKSLNVKLIQMVRMLPHALSRPEKLVAC
jgi:hypothetical protein